MQHLVAFDAHFGRLAYSVEIVEQKFTQWQREHPHCQIIRQQQHVIDETNEFGVVAPHFTLIVTYEELEQV